MLTSEPDIFLRTPSGPKTEQTREGHWVQRRSPEGKGMLKHLLQCSNTQSLTHTQKRLYDEKTELTLSRWQSRTSFSLTVNCANYCCLMILLQTVSNTSDRKSIHGLVNPCHTFTAPKQYDKRFNSWQTPYVCSARAHRHRIHFPPQFCMKSLLLNFSSY